MSASDSFRKIHSTRRPWAALRRGSGCRRAAAVVGALLLAGVVRPDGIRAAHATQSISQLPLTQLDSRPGTKPSTPSPTNRLESVQPTPSAPEGSPATQIPQPLQPLTVTQLDDELPPLDPDGGPRLSLRIVDPVPITDVLLGLVRNTGFSLVADPAIVGTFAGELKNATLREALEHVLPSLSLDYSIDGRFIRVFPVQLDTRLFDVDYVATRRTAGRVLDASTGFNSHLPSLQSSTASSRGEVSVNEAARPHGVSASPNGSRTTVLARDDTDFFDELTAGIATLLSDEGRFNLDRKAGLLQVTDLPDRLDRVGVYLEAVVNRVH